jgi:hypothetical protein
LTRTNSRVESPVEEEEKPIAQLLFGQASTSAVSPKSEKSDETVIPPPPPPPDSQEEDMATINRGPAIATPTPFDGDRTKTKRFLHECNLYISGKPRDFETGTPPAADDELKIAFVLSYMKDKTAATWAERYTTRPAAGTVVVAPNKAKAATFQAFIDELKDNFKEHNKAETTRLLLSKLK